jgi:galactose mutarotase-like enzyme
MPLFVITINNLNLPTMIILENDNIRATFAAKGAELQSLISKSNNLEYIWDGNPQFWAKHSPVLFPIVGALKNNAYRYKGQPYELSRHGFARDQEFAVEKVSDSELVFTVLHSEATLKVYPFEFTLQLRYTLNNEGLSCRYEVYNPGEDVLLFSIGGHPAFATPVDERTKYTDYSLRFNRDTELSFHKIQDNLISDETKQIGLVNRTLALKHELFYEDALVFKTLKSDQITLRNEITGAGMEFHFEGFPYFGIWAAKDADFVCLEPWCGIADGVDHNQELEEKEGIQRLEAGESWSRMWRVKIILPNRAG